MRCWIGLGRIIDGWRREVGASLVGMCGGFAFWRDGLVYTLPLQRKVDGWQWAAYIHGVDFISNLLAKFTDTLSKAH